MSTHPPEACVVHPLPPAPHFVGRQSELEELRDCWDGGFRGVLALVGLGGAGKTAVTARFLETVLAPPSTLDGIFVWSFYQEPDAGLFLQEAYRYFCLHEVAAPPAKGAGLLHLLRDALDVEQRYVLVLDGLERVQRQEGTDAYGQVDDPLLKGLLTRIAEGIGETTAVVTSRFPLTDLEPYRGQGYRHVEVGGLDREAAGDLLRSHGVRGDDPDLHALIDAYGSHALTLDHLGSLVGQFLNGDPKRAPELPALAASVSDRQAFRLARLLRAYEDHLPPEELTLLCRLCLLRRSVTAPQLAQFFLCQPALRIGSVREAAERIRNHRGHSQFPKVEVLNLADAIERTLEELMSDETIAGPEDELISEVAGIGDTLAPDVESLNCEIGDLAILYAGKEDGDPTDRLPLDSPDRYSLRGLYERYGELRDEMSLKQKGMKPLQQIFKYQKHTSRLMKDITDADLDIGIRKVENRLSFLVVKHVTLKRLRELCRFAQRKWKLAGPLAPLDAAELNRVLAALVTKRLVLHEADGSYSVHPAVRDHFYRLATSGAEGNWHDLIREQLISLVHKPGQRLPEAPAMLDMIEEAIFHARAAGRVDEALSLYRNACGGLKHLAWKLGEMTRGLRILRGFEPCPEPWDLAWFLRALGELDSAYEHNVLPFFRADIRLLQGRLPEVAAEGDSIRTSMAKFLMGQTTTLPAPVLGCALPRTWFLLLLGKLEQIRDTTVLTELYENIGWEGDRALGLLVMAEAVRRQQHPNPDHPSTTAVDYLAQAANWIAHSGSVEHLCFYHLVSARISRSSGDLRAAQRAVAEGLHLAKQSGLRLYHIDLLCEHAEILRADEKLEIAEQAAAMALRRAQAADCRYLWGAADAGHLLGQILVERRRIPLTGSIVDDVHEAKAILKKTLALRRQIGHPNAEVTERLLARIAE